MSHIIPTAVYNEPLQTKQNRIELVAAFLLKLLSHIVSLGSPEGPPAVRFHWIGEVAAGELRDESMKPVFRVEGKASARGRCQ